MEKVVGEDSESEQRACAAQLGMVGESGMLDTEIIEGLRSQVVMRIME